MKNQKPPGFSALVFGKAGLRIEGIECRWPSVSWKTEDGRQTFLFFYRPQAQDAEDSHEQRSTDNIRLSGHKKEMNQYERA